MAIQLASADNGGSGWGSEVQRTGHQGTVVRLEQAIVGGVRGQHEKGECGVEVGLSWSDKVVLLEVLLRRRVVDRLRHNIQFIHCGGAVGSRWLLLGLKRLSLGKGWRRSF